MLPDGVRALLFDMQQAASGVAAFTQNKSRDDFKSDLMLRRAVERQFEIIGEAMTRLRNLSSETAEKIAEYRGIISFRNVLIHGYDQINDDITWQIVIEKLPVLRIELETLLQEP